MVFEPRYPVPGTRISRGKLESSIAHRVMQPEPVADPGRPPERVTPRAFVLGLVTIVVMCIFSEHYGRGLVRSFMPMPALLMFMVWIAINLVLKSAYPRVALSRTEILMIFGMTWLVGTLPGLGLVGYLMHYVTGPAYFSTPEDRFWEVVGLYVPEFLLFEQGSPVVGPYYLGLRVGEVISWEAWFVRLYWWFVGILSVVMAGFFASVIFYRQWADKERLVFPLATFPVELLQESEESRLPGFVRNPIFWIGFATTFGLLAWNVAGWFILDLPRMSLYDHRDFKYILIARDFPPLNVRVHPFIIGLAYHCPLNILFNIWFFYLLSILKQGIMNRTGVSVGVEGQPADPRDILTLESHGALVVLVLWSVWVARGHLKETFQKAFLSRRHEDDGAPVSYRTAYLGFLGAAIFLLGWLMTVGFSLPVALLQMSLLFIIYFGMAKYAAATGFIFLRVPGGKGTLILKSILGTEKFSPSNLVGLVVVEQNAFVGSTARMLAIPGISHVFRMLGSALRRHPLIWLALPAALITGYTTQCWTHLYNSHTEGGMNVAFSGIPGAMLGLVSDIEGTDPTVFDVEKLTVWGVGVTEAALFIPGCRRLSSSDSAGWPCIESLFLSFTALSSDISWPSGFMPPSTSCSFLTCADTGPLTACLITGRKPSFVGNQFLIIIGKSPSVPLC